MFDEKLKYTKEAVYDVISDLRRIFFLFTGIAQLAYVAYLIYAMIAGVGVLAVNAAFSCLFLFCLTFFVIVCKRRRREDVPQSYGEYAKFLLLTADDFARISAFFNIFLQLFYISFAITSLINNDGIFVINLLLLCLSCSYLFVLLISYGNDDVRIKKLRGNARRGYKWIRIGVKTINAAIAIYGICITAGNINPADVIMPALMIIGWLFSLLLEIASHFVTSRTRYVVDAVKKDFSDPELKALLKGALVGAAVGGVASYAMANGGSIVKEGATRVKNFLKNKFNL